MTTTAQGQDGASLPAPVRRYQEAHDHHATEAALSAFTPDANVTDENRTYQGTDEIRRWLDSAAMRPKSTSLA
jgi:hypothetical protein